MEAVLLSVEASINSSDGPRLASDDPYLYVAGAGTGPRILPRISFSGIASSWPGAKAARDWYCRRKGWRLVSVSEQLDTGTAAGRLVLTVLAALAVGPMHVADGPA